jgi:hypothetical protein
MRARGKTEIAPELAFWVAAGFQPFDARSLVRAGFRSLDDLREVEREEFLRHRGLGPGILAKCERLLGRRLPGQKKEPVEVDLERDCGKVLSVMQWHHLGFPHSAAREFAARKETPESLRRLTREELLALKGFGEGAFDRWQRVFGSDQERGDDPAERYWTRRHLPAYVARSLVKAGVRSIRELRTKSREDLLRIRFVGRAALERLEVLAGFRFPSAIKSKGKVSFWRSVGVAPKFERKLHAAGIRAQRDFVKLTREQFLVLPGLGSGALYACEQALGIRLLSPVSFWIHLEIPKRLAIRLAELGIATVDDLTEAEAEYLLRNGVSFEEAVLLRRVARRLR